MKIFKNNTVLLGSLWTTLSTGSTAVVQILRLSILAHFLETSDFGVVAILTMILGFTNIFSELGFSTVVMHKKDLSNEEFSSLYWTQFVLYLLMYILFSSISQYISYFFSEPSITYLLPIAMIDLLLCGIGRLYDTVMQKNLQFRVLAQRNIVASISSLALAVILAYCGVGVYSLIISTLFQSFILNIWNLIQGAKIIPLRLYCSLPLIKPLINIGIYQTGSNILDYISTKRDVFIIGKLLGSEILGVYNLAKELILKGSMLVNTIVNRVALPLFAQKQNNIDALQQNYRKLISIVALINFPICTIIGVLGYVIIPVLYGERYIEVVPILYIISIWGCFNCIGNPVSNITIATGRTNMSLKYTVLRLVCYIPCMMILSLYNIEVLAWGTTILTLVFIFVSWFMLLYKTIQFSLTQFVSSFIKPLVYTLLIGSIGYKVIELLADKDWDYISLLMISIIWVCIYMSIYIYIERRVIKSMINMVKA